MARGGRRTYVRDANGRFASTPGGGLGAARKAARSRSGRASTLQARTSLKKSRAKLAKRDLADQRLSTSLSARAQKGAVTRGNKGLKAAKVAAKTRLAKVTGVIGKTRKATKPTGKIVNKLNPTTKSDSNKRTPSARSASKKSPRKALFQMTEADARKLGTLEAGRPISETLKTVDTLRKLRNINAPKSSSKEFKRNEKLDRAFTGGMSTAKAASLPKVDWMPDFAGNRLKEIKGTPDTPFYRYMLYKTGRVQSGPLRPGLGKKMKTMQGVSYGKPAAKSSAPSSEKQPKKAAPKASTNSRFRPGEFYRGNFRPRNVTGRPVKHKNPFQLGKGVTDAVISASSDDTAARMNNVKIAKNLFESRGISVKLKSNKRNSSVATYNSTTKEVSINRSHPHWINPAKDARRARATREFSDLSPMHIINHEIGHAKDKNIRNNNKISQSSEMRKIARRVSMYAATSQAEFVAEAYAGRRAGRKYDYQVMDAYREARGLPTLRLRSQKPLRRKPKP